MISHSSDFRCSASACTRTIVCNSGGNQEYTSCGQHLLNPGFTVKWFRGNELPADSVLHSFKTGIDPLYVYAAFGVDANGNPVCQ